MGRSRLGSSLQRVEDPFENRSVLFYIRDQQMVCFTPAFLLFPVKCVHHEYIFGKARGGKGPLMTPLTCVSATALTQSDDG